jgi:flagellar assembly factor FliW
VIQPDVFLKSAYSPEVLSGELEALSVKKPGDCAIYLIVTIPENEPQKMTANMQGPVLINAEKKIGRQVISINDKHLVRVPILEQMEG